MTAVSRTAGDLCLDQPAPYRGTLACEGRVGIFHIYPAPSKMEQADLESKIVMCLTFLSVSADRADGGTGWKALPRRKGGQHPA